jgi:hypothetical protein
MSVAAKEWAIWADQNEPGRHESMAMKMSPSPNKVDKVFPVVNS